LEKGDNYAIKMPLRQPFGAFPAIVSVALRSRVTRTGGPTRQRSAITKLSCCGGQLSNYSLVRVHGTALTIAL
jgi:hypothetical protein